MTVEDLLFKVLLRFKVVHSIPGRIRIHIPMSRKIPEEWGASLEHLDRLTNLKGIEKVSFSNLTGNALINYDPEVTSEKEIIDALREIAKVFKTHHKEITRRADQNRQEALEYLLDLLRIHISWPEATEENPRRSASQ